MAVDVNQKSDTYAEDSRRDDPDRYLSMQGSTFVGVASTLIFALCILLFFFLFWFVSFRGHRAADGSIEISEYLAFAFIFLAGAAGAFIHQATSFAAHVGNKTFQSSWVWWQILRVPIGATLAVIVYFAVRGLNGGEATAATIIKFDSGFYVWLFTAALAGLFSKQMTFKLSEVVDNILALSVSIPLEGKLTGKRTAQDAGVQTYRSAETRSPQGQYAEIIKKVQQNLITQGRLPELTPSGKPGDDGIDGPETKRAVAAFLEAKGISPQEVNATLGDELSPDYWNKLLELTSEAES
jgi:hypothetical protein